MLQIKQLEASPAVTINGRTISLSEADIDAAWWHTSDLIDANHRGPAYIPLGPENVLLHEPEWLALYEVTLSHILDGLEAVEHLGETIH